MARHSKTYKEFLQEKRKTRSDDLLRRQGQILAEALRGQFDAAVQATAVLHQLPPGPTPFIPTGPAPDASGGADTLNSLQRKIAESELDHKCKLATGARGEFQVQVSALRQDKSLVNKLGKLLAQHPELGPVPKRREDKVNALFNLFKSNA